MDKFYIMGIDPGSNNVGVSIFELDGKLEIVKIHTYNLVLNVDESNGIYDAVVDRLNKLSFMIKAIYNMYTPTMVGMESCFINPGRLGAVIPLSRSIHTIETSIVSLDAYAKIISIPPGLIKKIFGVSQKGKGVVSEGLKSKLYLTSKIKKELSEHEIDAVAITVTLLEYIKTTDGMSCIKYIDLE